VRKGMKYNDSQPYFVIQEGGGKKSKPVIKRAMKRLGRKKELRIYKLRDAGVLWWRLQWKMVPMRCDG